MADDLWRLGQEVGMPHLVKFHDGSLVESEKQMKNRESLGKHLVLGSNAINTLNLLLFKDMYTRIDEITDQTLKNQLLPDLLQ